MQKLSNASEYAQLWKKESEHIESLGIYEQLAKVAPEGNVLEFGCGIGKSTFYLSKNHNVLSLDSNPDLIKEALKYLKEHGSTAKIHKCDFFELTDDDKKIISDFKPQVIVGWLIGSNGMDIFKHTKEESKVEFKPKLYREKIEDILISPDICLPSVEYIHLVNRGGLIEGFTDKDYFEATKKDYDTYVFNQIDFEVFQVDQIGWSREGSDFEYGQAPNPNLAQGISTTVISSILARRIKK